MNLVTSCDNVTELLFEAIRGYLSFLDLEDLNQMPLEEVIVTAEVVLDLKYFHGFIRRFLDRHLFLLPVVLKHEHLEQQSVAL